MYPAQDSDEESEDDRHVVSSRFSVKPTWEKLLTCVRRRTGIWHSGFRFQGCGYGLGRKTLNYNQVINYNL